MRYELWLEGHRATGDSSRAVCLGSIGGHSFSDAVERYVKEQEEGVRKLWQRDGVQWSYWGRRAFANEVDARRSFG